MGRLKRFTRANAITKALALLISIVVFIITYALVSRRRGLPSSPVMKFRPKIVEGDILIQILEQGEDSELKMEKKQSLVEDLMWCSLAMGMSRKELRRNMVNL